MTVTKVSRRRLLHFIWCLLITPLLCSYFAVLSIRVLHREAVRNIQWDERAASVLCPRDDHPQLQYRREGAGLRRAKLRNGTQQFFDSFTVGKTIYRLYAVFSPILSCFSAQVNPQAIANEAPAQGIKMEVGIEDCLHIEFEFDKQKYHLKVPIADQLFNPISYCIFCRWGGAAMRAWFRF